MLFLVSCYTQHSTASWIESPGSLRHRNTDLWLADVRDVLDHKIVANEISNSTPRDGLRPICIPPLLATIYKLSDKGEVFHTIIAVTVSYVHNNNEDHPYERFEFEQWLRAIEQFPSKYFIIDASHPGSKPQVFRPEHYQRALHSHRTLRRLRAHVVIVNNIEFYVGRIFVSIPSTIDGDKIRILQNVSSFIPYESLDSGVSDYDDGWIVCDNTLIDVK